MTKREEKRSAETVKNGTQQKEENNQESAGVDKAKSASDGIKNAHASGMGALGLSDFKEAIYNADGTEKEDVAY